MAEKILYAMYDDDRACLAGAKKIVGKGVQVRDAFSPFPIHGIDPVIGVKHTRLGICAFLYGLTGLLLLLLGVKYFMITDWPMIVGGKPNGTLLENLPAFMPPAFEFTVFCACHGMALTYLLRNKTLPGMPPRNPDPRTTDDKFVLEIRTEDNHGKSADELQTMLKETGIIELDIREIEDKHEI
jgi:hypothetical protein